MDIRQHLASNLKKVLLEVTSEEIAQEVDPNVFPIKDLSHGDYYSSFAMQAFGRIKAGRSGEYVRNVPVRAVSPMELAEMIKKAYLLLNDSLIEKIDVVAPGYINFFLSKSFLLSEVEKYIGNPQKNFAQSGHGKSAVVEYSSPNIAKPFTVGHLRSTIIGDAVANLLQAAGWTVHRDNHIGDWGTQFGKQIYAIKTWGSEDEIEKSERPVRLLVDLYVKFHEEAEKNPAIEDEARAWFKKLEDGDSEAKRLWKKCVDWSWKEFDGIYAKLGVAFTENEGRGFGESYFEDKMAAVIKELEEKNLLKTGDEGAKLVFFPDDKYPPLMILKKDGSTLYATRDLATDKFRLEQYGKDILVINEVGGEQALYFRQLYEVEQMLGWYAKDRRVHIKHGLYRFKNQKMSTRKGNTIWLEDVLEEAKKRASALAKASQNPENSDNQEIRNSDGLHFRRSELAELSEVVGIGALKWNDLKRSPEQDIVFEWEDILNMQGNSGPYMQYAYARTQSILEKAGIQNSELRIKNLKLEIEERDLARLIVRFADTVGNAADRYAPHIVATYLFELAQAFSLFYQKHQILKEEGAVREWRLLLTRATGKVLKSGLSILGIKVLQKM